jgi:uncharacterized protein YgbK (DUF1537 family)
MSQIRISFYGDDFTGSTDALESLALAGLRTVLFTNPPTREQLAKYPELRAFGVAGMTRSMRPEEMGPTLRPVFTSLRDLGAPIVHYKVCSTFDSSPDVGSIGKAIDLGAEIFKTQCVPVLVGAPSLGRYCVFGNLFARCGAESEPYRLDRHPSMSRHPITPMDEADLRAHLAKQTNRTIGLLDVLKLESSNVESEFDAVTASNEAALIDMLHERHLATAGRLIDRLSKKQPPLFVVGSSGVESALSAHWRLPSPMLAKLAKADSIVAICGSCSPVTAGQIRHAVQHGFAEVEIAPLAMDEQRATRTTLDAIRSGKSVVIHTGVGNASKRVADESAKNIGPALGKILRSILAESKVRRVIVAGGDTSGAVARALGIESMEMIAQLTRGSPMCRAGAPASPADAIEITFKGGQIGPQSFFTDVLGRS